MARRRVPTVLQMEAVECGAASLTMILAYYGHYAPLGEVREACGVSRDGMSAQGIVVAARRYGLKPRARSSEPEELSNLRGPAIIHWEMDHFVVLERWTPSKVYLVDPALGRRTIAKEDFNTSFTGICIEFEKTPEFKPRKRERLSLRRYIALLSGSGGPLAMVLTMTVCLNLLALCQFLVPKIVLDHVLSQGRIEWFWVITITAVVMLVTSGLLSFLRSWVFASIRRALDYSMSMHFLRHLIKLPLTFFTQRSTADLMSRIQSTKVIRDVLAGHSLALLVDGLLLTTYLVLMLLTDLRLSIVVLLAGAGQIALFFVARPIQHQKMQELQVRQVREGSQLVQMLLGALTIKCSGNETDSHQRWLNLHIGALNAELQETRVADIVRTIQFLLQASVPVAVLVLGGQHVVAGKLSLGSLVAFQMLQAGFLGPLNQVLSTLLHAQILPVMTTRMDDVLETKPPEYSSRSAPRLAGEIEFEHISFRYGPTSPLVLDDISFRIPKGTKVALVGPSGSGKSTIARLLLQFYSFTQGEIRIDGININEWDPDSIRRQTGVVLQETSLFRGTIRENLSLWDPNAPLQDVINAARAAQIHDDIQALPLGYDTVVSASGGTFSGGQRQRLALARAILHHPSIIVLDEATSALDTVTEAAIHNYFALRHCTRIVIAHRLSTVRDADLILVLANGKIVEQGQHDTLLAQGGLYAELVAKGDAEPVEAKAPAVEATNLVTGESLRAFPILESFLPEDLAALAEPIQRLSFQEGDVIIHQHDKPAGLFFVEEGTVEIQIATPGLANRTVATLSPGEIFGEISLLDGTVSSAAVVAGAGCRVLCLPSWQFQQLSNERDVLARRLLMALGRLVSSRIRELANKQRAQARSDSDSDATELAASPPPGRVTTQRVFDLRETPFGASFTDTELTYLREVGSMRSFAKGEVIMREGEPSHNLYVLLAGRVQVEVEGVPGIATVLKPGALFGQINFFDLGPRTATCSATQNVSVFALPIETVHHLLEAGNAVMWKILKAVTLSIVWHFRLENARLHAAESDDAETRAFQLRERRLAERQVAGEVESSSPDQPVLAKDRPELEPAACLTWILRHHQRPIGFQTVADACEEVGGSPTNAVVETARLFGFSSRKMQLSTRELRYIDAPLMLWMPPKHFVVGKRWRRGQLELMDPVEGHISLTEQRVNELVGRECLEILPDRARQGMGTPLRALIQFAKDHAQALIALVVASTLFQFAGLVPPLILGAMVSTVLPSHELGLLYLMGICVAAVVALQFVISLTRDSAVRLLATHFDRDLLDQLVAHIFRLPISFFERYRPADTLQRLGSFRVLRDLLANQGLVTFLDLGSVLVALVALLSLAPGMGIALATIVVVHIIVLVAMIRPLSRLAVEELDKGAAQQDNLLELLGGITTLRATGSPGRALQHWTPSFVEELNVSFREERINAVLVPALAFLRSAGLSMVVLWGAWAVLHSEFQVGTLIALQGVAAGGFIAVGGLVGQLIGFTRGAIHVRRTSGLFDEKPEQASELLMSPGKLRGNITIDHVSFRYRDDLPLALDDVTLSIKSGMKVALVGRSGSGKSTLGKLLVGAYMPQAGRILFDGKDAAQLDLGALRRQVGVVLQDTFLFGSSIRENLTLSAPRAKMEDLERAAAQAAIAKDIEALPMGYDTVLSEGGSTFSGGQRQRLSIARALVSKPAILLLDEATSALDNKSQAIVERGLVQVGCTRVVIAHRLSTVINSDLIVVMEAGRIVESGTHEELVEKKGMYASLVAAQTL